MNEQTSFEQELALRRELIENQDRNNIMISAGAGAGKTDTMSENLLHRLLHDDSIKESEVVAITFTNAATEEMRSRLHDKNRKLRQTAAQQGKPLRSLQIDDIHVSTIHSFCASLITQMAFDCELGIAPAIALKQELKNDPLVIDFLHETLNRSTDYQDYIEYMTPKGGWKAFCDLFFELAQKPELSVVIDAPEPSPVDLTPIQVLLQLLADNRAAIKARPEACDSRRPADKLLSQRGINTYAVSDLCRLFASFTDCTEEETKESRIESAKPLYNTLSALLQKTHRLLSDNNIPEATSDNHEAVYALLQNSGILSEWESFDWQTALDTNLFDGNLAKLKNALDGMTEKQRAGKKYWTQIKSFLNTYLLPLAKGEKKLAKAELLKPFEPKFSGEDRTFLHWLEAALAGKGIAPTAAETLEILTERKEQLDAYYTYLLAKIVKKLYEDFTLRKKDRIDSNDLLVIAKNLLCKPENTAVRDYFRRKYKLLYVDEFQDIDFLQFKILTALACDENHHLRDGCLFVVGDPKQAIYRFRGGEVAFYEHTKQAVFPPDCFHTFRINFRSDKSVVDWINGKYSGTPPPDWGDIPATPMLSSFACEPPAANTTPADASLHDTASTAPKQLTPGVSEIIYSSDDYAAMTAERVRELLTMELPEYDRKLQKTVYRPVEPGDIMVITMKKKPATNIYRALKSRNIPVTVTGDLQASEKRSIRRLCALMRYLENSSRLRLTEVAIAFSPHAGTDKNGVERDGSLADSFTPRQAHRLFAILEESRQLNRQSGPLAVVINAINQGYLLDGALTESELADEMPILFQLAEMLPGECSNDLGAVNHYLESFLQKKLSDVLAPTAENSCVRVMNVHQTKGLQANIVLYVQVKNDREPPSHSFVEYYREASDSHPFEIYDHPVCHLVMSEETTGKKDQLRTQEKTRLRYVLDTRARYVMEQYTYRKAKDDTAPPPPPTTAAEALKRLSLIPKTAQMPEQPTCTLSASPSRLEIPPGEYDDPAASKAAPKPISYHEGFAALNGTIMHRAFELYFISRKLQRPTTDDDSILYCARQAINESYRPLREMLPQPDQQEYYLHRIADLLKDFIQWFGTSSFKDCAASTELPFVCVLKEGERDDKELRELIEANRKADMTKAPRTTPAKKIIFSGKSDLICTAPDHTVTVIDYKSDRPGYHPVTLLNTYAPQQLAYRLVLKQFVSDALTVSDREILYAPNAFPQQPLIIGWLLLPDDE